MAKWQHESLALGFVTSRMLGAAFIVIGVMSLLAVGPCGRTWPVRPA